MNIIKPALLGACSVLVSTFFSSLASAQSAQNISIDQSLIEEAVVTASPHAKTQAEIAGSLNVLNREALQREVSSTLGETLKNQLGVHSSSFGAGVGVPVIRGQSGKRVEVLQNGATVSDVSDTSSDHAVATEALLADRIEILRGPATLRYGAGAIGSVVNVIDNRIHTERFEGAEALAELRYNSNNNEAVAVGRIDLGANNWGLHIDGVTRNSDNVEIPGFADLEADDADETTNGYIENSDREASSFSIGLSWIGDSVVVGASLSHLDNNYGLPSGGHAHGHHEEHGEEEHDEDDHDEEVHEEEGHDEDEELLVRIDMEQTQYQAKLQFNDLAGTFERLDIDLNYTDYNHNELEIDEGLAEIGTVFDLSTTELGAELIHGETAGWLGAFGLQISDKNFDAEGLEAFVPPSQTKQFGLYVLEEAELGAGTLELGARYDRQKISGDEFDQIKHSSTNLSASYLMPLGEGQKLAMVLSRAERTPVAEELLSDGEHVATSTYEIGSADLNTESSFNAELTWAKDAQTSSGISARASLFYSDFSGYIYEMDTEFRFSHDLEEDGFSGLNACSESLADFDNDSEEYDESLECFLYTQEDATFTGIEAEVEIPVAETGHSARLWGDYVRADFAESGDVPRMPPARIGASWNYQDKVWTGQLNVTHAFDQNRAGEGQEATQGYTRLDAYLSWNNSWNNESISVFLRGDNLTNEDIRNSTSFLREVAPETGRAITLGTRYNF